MRFLRNEIEKNNNIIIMTDLFYDVDSDRYQNEHHSNPKILKGFDSDLNAFLLIDENLADRCRGVQSKALYGFTYHHRWIKAEDLNKMLNTTQVIRTEGNDENHLHFIKVQCSNHAPIDINTIKNDFKWYWRNVKDNRAQIERQIINDMQNLNTTDKSSDYWYTFESLLNIHHEAMLTLIYILEFSIDNLIIRFNKIIQEYDFIRKKIYKYSIKKSESEFKNICYKILKTFEMENEIYSFLDNFIGQEMPIVPIF